MTNMRIKLISIYATPLLLLGCAAHDPNPALEDARAVVDAARNDPAVITEAPTALNDARDALARAQAIYEDSGNKERTALEHEAYLAKRYAAIARSRAETAQAQADIERAEQERDEVLLRARTREAERAEARADAALSAAAELERELERLQAEQTERGLVLTLDDVLFDTNRAELKPGAEASLNRLANFLAEYPDRIVRIEGHTDSRGTDQYNEQLSERRANAVRNALLDRGVAADRIQTRGLGESIPVASNETAAGRQQNRRVEIVISDEDGDIPALSAAR